MKISRTIAPAAVLLFSFGTVTCYHIASNWIQKRLQSQQIPLPSRHTSTITRIDIVDSLFHSHTHRMNITPNDKNNPYRWERTVKIHEINKMLNYSLRNGQVGCTDEEYSSANITTTNYSISIDTLIISKDDACVSTRSVPVHLSGLYTKNLKNILSQTTLTTIGAVLYNTQVALAAGRFGKSNVVYNGAIGYEAAASAFSPGQNLKTIPLLPQSALLNSLPMNDELIGQLQAYFESFVQLISPLPTQTRQISNNNSILWKNLRVNAQRAAGIFISNRRDLMPQVNMSDLPTDLFIRTYEIAGRTLDRLQVDALKLVNSSSKSQISDSLRSMQKCLNGLCDIAYLLSNPLSISIKDDESLLFNTTTG